MAKIVRGKRDPVVQALKRALDAYEASYPGAATALYRSNPASIRLRLIDRRFEGMTKSRRHADVWNFLAARVNEDALADISQLLALAPSELKTSPGNLEFEDPVASNL